MGNRVFDIGELRGDVKKGSETYLEAKSGHPFTIWIRRFCDLGELASAYISQFIPRRRKYYFPKGFVTTAGGGAQLGIGSFFFFTCGSGNVIYFVRSLVRKPYILCARSKVLDLVSNQGETRISNLFPS